MLEPLEPLEPKMSPCVVGSVVGWSLTTISYFVDHATSIAAVFAVFASIFTMLAAFEKWRWYRHKRKGKRL